jgi:hypothetical protein
MFNAQSFDRMLSLASMGTFPTVATRTSHAFCLTFAAYFYSRMLKSLSIPIDPPIEGI